MIDTVAGPSRLGDGWTQFAETSSFVPLVALIAGRAKLSLAEFGWTTFAAATVVILVVLYLHPLVIGVSPLPT